MRLAVILDPRSFLRFSSALVRSIPAAVRSKGLGAAYRAMWGHETTFRIGRRRIVLPGRWFGYAAEIYARRVYTWFPGFGIRPTDVVVDLGAAGGVFSVLAGSLGKRVIAVEAEGESVRALEANVAMNRLSNVEVVRGVVGGDAGLLSRPGASGSPSPRVSFGELLSRFGVPTVDFLKVDIEGSEFDLFFNRNEWLPRVRRIAMEVHTEFGDPDSLRSLLESNGFRVRLVDLNQRTVPRISGDAGYLFAERNAAGV